MEKDSAIKAERPKTPEFRSFYTAKGSGSSIPAMSKFDDGDTAWLTTASRRSFEVVIYKVNKRSDGRYEYQVTENGSLYKGGEWVAEANLNLAK
ncbi:hypothetical protein BJ875DRAFT_493325 [Amylocarpus encephaloides]|uniref:Uncharacterized protein n=1 Tax=Amylocarpus encephaloides TaxID=45428 RepID=A0A9P7YP70_9HELO|nr:hypothetical protein BJ875DRAFT_493325 [Amylocarpus encephaloides]